nr:immunoglobulin light chain junction region [Macaca mulatta]MOV81672.1 immunoglobulin light chain junction region [Macaca mulatta]
CQENDNWPRTF